MNEQRLCRDCKHVGGIFFHTCKAPQNKRAPDLVTGSSQIGYEYCRVHRSSNAQAFYDCGSEGRFFEHRVPLFERIKLVFSGSKP